MMPVPLARLPVPLTCMWRMGQLAAGFGGVEAVCPLGLRPSHLPNQHMPPASTHTSPTRTCHHAAPRSYLPYMHIRPPPHHHLPPCSPSHLHLQDLPVPLTCMWRRGQLAAGFGGVEAACPIGMHVGAMPPLSGPHTSPTSTSTCLSPLLGCKLAPWHAACGTWGDWGLGSGRCRLSNRRHDTIYMYCDK